MFPPSGKNSRNFHTLGYENVENIFLQKLDFFHTQNFIPSKLISYPQKNENFFHTLIQKFHTLKTFFIPLKIHTLSRYFSFFWYLEIFFHTLENSYLVKMFFNFIPCQDIFHTLKKQFHTLTFKFLFSYLKKLFSYFYTKISYLVKTFFIPLNFYFHTFVDLFHTLGTFFIPFRPGTLRLMTAPRDPARLDCDHPWPSPAVAHP